MTRDPARFVLGMVLEVRTFTALCSVWAAMTGCAGEASILDGECSFEGEGALSSLDGHAVHDLALASREGGAWAAWSEDSGLYVAGLDREGALALPIRRIGPPCAAGIDASDAEGMLLLACGIPANDAKDDPGHAVVYEVSEGGWRARDRFEPMGPNSLGVAIAASEHGYALAWHDGRRGSSSVWVLNVDDTAAAEAEAMRELFPEAALGPAPRRASAPGRRPGPPSLLMLEGHRFLAWAETSLDADGDPLGDVLVQEDELAPRSLATVQSESAMPVLAATEDHRVLVSFRDRRRRGRPRAYSMWVPARGQDGSLISGPPANTDGPALMVPCMGSALAVTPRTHSRHERLVSVRRHDGITLEGRGPEMQLYESAAAYEHAAALCVAGDEGSPERLLILYAARESDDHVPGSVRAANVRCRAP